MRSSWIWRGSGSSGGAGLRAAHIPEGSKHGEASRYHPGPGRGERKLIRNISSGLGSIANNGRGSSVGYRSSKAALNMQTRTLAMELQDEGFVCIAMSPGWVRTDMAGERAPLSPEESVRGMLGTLAPLGPEQTGQYYNHNGQQLPW